MNSRKIHKLVLYPRPGDFALTSWDELITRLREVGFLGEQLDKTPDKISENRFLIGEGFFQYISFMGCSPSMEVTPPTDGSLDFCHIRCSRIYPGTWFRSASRNVFARCPQCRKRISNWEQAVSLWSRDSSAVNFNCDKCGEPVSLFQLDWKHTTAFARMFIDIYNIFPQEGIPTDQLLSLLETQTGTQWEYFFTDQ